LKGCGNGAAKLETIVFLQQEVALLDAEQHRPPLDDAAFLGAIRVVLRS
jgi:hypothetical protein